MRHFRLLPLFLTVPALAQGAVQGFRESFEGTGPFQSIDGGFDGLDVPGWEIVGNGQLESGAYVAQNYDEDIVNGGGEHDILSREVVGNGSFTSNVEIRDVFLGDVEVDDPPTSTGQIQLSHTFATEVPDVALTLLNDISPIEPGQWILASRMGENIQSAVVTSGENISLSIMFDNVASEITFIYDENIDDELPGCSMGPLALPGEMREFWRTQLRFSAGGTGRANGRLEHWTLLPLSPTPGDFNGNSLLDVGDIDQLSEQVRTGSSDLLYDLNADTFVNNLDRQLWVHVLKQTFFGDADLKGTFDSTDLVQVLAFGEYEDATELNSTWLTGDWTGDGDFTSGDLVAALADGGYEAPTLAVPEPVGVVLTMAIAALAVTSRRPKTRRK